MGAQGEGQAGQENAMDSVRAGSGHYQARQLTEILPLQKSSPLLQSRAVTYQRTSATPKAPGFPETLGDFENPPAPPTGLSPAPSCLLRPVPARPPVGGGSPSLPQLHIQVCFLEGLEGNTQWAASQSWEEAPVALTQSR